MAKKINLIRETRKKGLEARGIEPSSPRWDAGVLSNIPHRVLRAVLTFKISNTKKDSGFDSRIYVQIIWYTHIFPLSALIKSLLWVFGIASIFPYLDKKKMIFEKNHAYKCWQRKKLNIPCDSFVDSAVENTFLFCVRNIEGWNHSEHPVNIVWN